MDEWEVPEGFQLPWQNYRQPIRWAADIAAQLVEVAIAQAKQMYVTRGPEAYAGNALMEGGGPFRTAPTSTELVLNEIDGGNFGRALDQTRALISWARKAAEIDIAGAFEKQNAINQLYEEASNFPGAFSGGPFLEVAHQVLREAAAMIRHLISQSGTTQENAQHRSLAMLRAVTGLCYRDNATVPRQVVLNVVYHALAQGQPLHPDVQPAFEAAWLAKRPAAAFKLVLDAIEKGFYR